jgi:hypothetical protein
MHPERAEPKLAELSNDELVSALTAASPPADPRSVLAELALRDAPELGAAARAVLDDESADDEARRAAAIALGRRAEPQNETALVRALSARDIGIVRHAAASLGKIGERPALEALRAVDARDRPVPGRAIAFARSLIAYRLGLEEERLARPSASELLQLHRGDAVPLDIEPVPDGAFQSAASELAAELPRLPLATSGSVRMSCLGEHLWVALAEEVAKGGRERIAARSAVAAVVLKLSTCPQRWYVHEYVLTHPVDDGAQDAFGVRPTGRLVHFGSLKLRQRKTLLTLGALDVAGVPAIQLGVTYRKDGTLSVREALRSKQVRGDTRDRLPVQAERPAPVR